MATVPISQGPTVEARPQPFVPQSAQFDPNAFGAGVGTAEQGLGKVTSDASEEGAKIATSMAVTNDQRAAKVSDTQHQTAVTGLGFNSLPGGPDGNKGYFSLQGQDAVTYRPVYEKALQDSNTAISDTLKDSPRAQNFYNTVSGPRVAAETQRSAMYANSQGLVADNNASAARLGAYKDNLTTNYNDPDALANFQQVTRGEVADTGRRMGWGTDQIAEATTKALSGGYRDAILSRATSGDIAGATQMFNSLKPGMDAGTQVALGEHLAPLMLGAQADAMVKSLMGTPRGSGGAATIADAIHGQESGGKSTSATSVDGAVGGWQIMPDTFKANALPGESITVPADNERVGRRLIDKYSTAYNGDAGRVATAYFSGEGNVAPAGSATPYIKDTHDGNGKYVSSYVSDVTRRLGTDGSYKIAGPPVGNSSDANPAIHPDFAGMQQKLLDATDGNPKLQQAVLSRLHTAAGQYELSTQADRDQIDKNWKDNIASATAGNDTVNFNESMVRHVFRPDVADYMMGQAQEATTAGQLNSALKLATKPQADAILADLAAGLGPRATIDHLRGKTVVPGPGAQGSGEVDTPDFTDKYNTKLSPEDEAKFQAWGLANPDERGRNPAKDTFDYDMRGFWKAADGKPSFSDTGHAGDPFKKPNHPTFSDLSQYNTVDGYQGGHWNPVGGGKYTYDPSQTNIQMKGMEGPDGLKSYFAGPAEAGVSTLNVPAPPAEDPAHYVQRQKALSSAQTFLAQRTKMLADDPATYAMQDPNVASAYKAIDPNNPASVQAAADASFSTQRSLGVDQPRVLGAADAAAMVKSIEAPNQADMGAKLNDLQTKYGPHYGDVVADLTKAGLSPRYQMLAHANLPEQATVRSDAQAAFQQYDGLKDKAQWGEGLPADQKKLLEPAVDAAIAPFRKTMQSSSDPRDIVGTTIKPAITQTAQYYMTRGMPAEAAVDKAKQLITKSYNFDDELRVPAGPGMPTVSQVRTSMSGLTEGLTDADLESAESYNARTAGMNRAPAVGPPTTAVEAQRGTWFTNGDDKGATLFKGTTQAGYMPVRRADGSYLSIPFNKLPTPGPAAVGSATSNAAAVTGG